MIKRSFAQLTVLKIYFPEMSLLGETFEEHSQSVIGHFLVDNELNNLKLGFAMGSDY